MKLEDLEKIKNAFDEYCREQNQKLENKGHLERLKTTKTKLEWVIGLINTHNETKLPISELLKQNCSLSKYWQMERKFYRFKKRMEEFLANPNLSIAHLVNNATSRKPRRTKYSPEQCQRIRDAFFSSTNQCTVSALWMKFRTLAGFEKISFRTFAKIIRSDNRYQKNE